MTETCDYPSGTAVDYCPDLSAAATSRAAFRNHRAHLAPCLPCTEPASRVYQAQQPLFAYVPRSVDLDYDPTSGAMNAASVRVVRVRRWLRNADPEHDQDVRRRRLGNGGCEQGDDQHVPQ